MTGTNLTGDWRNDKQNFLQPKIKKTILLSNFMILAALIGLLFSGESLLLLYLSVGWMAIFYGVTFPIYSSCAGDFFPEPDMGTVIGAWPPSFTVAAPLPLTGFPEY